MFSIGYVVVHIEVRSLSNLPVKYARVVSFCNFKYGRTFY